MLSRRLFLGLFSAVLGSGGATNTLLAAAAEPGGWTGPSGSVASAFKDIRRRAGGAGVPAPRAPAAEITDEYDVILPELVDLISALDRQQRELRTPSGELEAALRDASELLGALADAERSPFTDGDLRAARTYDYEPLRDGYLTLYDNCAVRHERAAITNWHIGTLLKPENRSRYDEVQKRLQIPWYFIGIIHGLEASFNFMGHLHNGDAPLTKRTRNVPRNRPEVWLPPSDWESSAKDALAYDGFLGQTDWSLEAMLYRWEAYNGWGYRHSGRPPTPYLWSFSNHYNRGKFASDGRYDPQLKSQQCGAGIMLKELLNAGDIAQL